MSSTITTSTTPQITLSSSEPVIGTLRYIPAGHVPEKSPHNYHLPAISEFSDVRHLSLRNMRPLPSVSDLAAAENHAQLATHGFTAVTHPTTLHFPPFNLSSWKDPSLLTEHYIPDTVAMLKRITGCSAVITEALLLRSALWTESDALATHAGHGRDIESDEPQPDPSAETLSLETGFPAFIGFNASQGGVSPAPKPHVDYSPTGSRTHLRKYHPELTMAAAAIIAAEDALLAEGKSLKENYHSADSPGGPRWALYSIWRPLKPVRRDPLALLDQRTLRDEDFISVNITTPCLGREDGSMETHEAEGYLASYREGHEWNWIEDQKPEEVLVIGLFDSGMEREGGIASGGTLHSSVELAGREGEEARESLELRCLCVW
ncbi:GA4 desaturase [Podospora appendiculata]|uniref:GA4 desaturase n=1 Tax=Podospora appendiculata TaxID=314037 RepID=A0AAE1CE73_9PEZI|nr:GA4 desaturase [Podospora appendiculata]